MLEKLPCVSSMKAIFRTGTGSGEASVNLAVTECQMRGYCQCMDADDNLEAEQT